MLVTIYFSFSSGKISNYCKDPDKKVYGLVDDGITNSLFGVKHYYNPDSGARHFQVDTEKIDDEKTKCHVKSKGRRFYYKGQKVTNNFIFCIIIGLR